MNFLTLVNGLRTLVSRVDFIDIANGSFRIRLTGTATVNRQVDLPDDTGIVLLDNRPVGSLGAGVSVRGYSPNVSVSSSKTLALSDANTTQICTATSTITLPLNATVAYPVGTEILILRNTSATITLALTGGVTATDCNGTTNTLTAITNYSLLKKTATDTWAIVNPVPNNVNLPGDPTCDTQSPGVNNTRIANTAFVEAITVARVDNLSKVRYLFVIAGESNAGGYAVNSTLTADQLLAQAHAKIWNNTSSVFQALQIGTNNLLGHSGTPDNATHGIERGLAREILNTLQWPEAYILKAGQGGSTIAQWSVGNATGYLSTLTSRYNAAVTALTNSGYIVRPVFIWLNGINDAVGGTATATFRTATQAHFTQIRSFMGAGTPVFMPQIMPTNAAYTAINTEIATIDAADANMWALATVSIPNNPSDPNHYTANGYLQIVQSFVDSFRNNLGVPGTFSIGQSRTAASNPVISLKRNTILSIPVSASTLIPLNVVEVDTDNMFNASTGKIVIPVGAEGVYSITAMVTINVVLQLRTQVLINEVLRAQSPLFATSSDTVYGGELTRVFRLNAGDVVSLKCSQTNAMNVTKDLLIEPEFQSCLQMVRIGR